MTSITHGKIPLSSVRFTNMVSKPKSISCNHIAQPSLFCFGLGYLGATLSTSIRHASGTVASEAELLGKDGSCTFMFGPQTGYALDEDAKVRLHNATHILSTIPPCGSNGHDVVLKHVRSDIELASQKSLRWLGYISTTSVYGGWNGDWVDESSQVRASDSKNLARVAAENEWLNIGEELTVPAHVFRCGGIYGPGRSVVESLRRGRRSGNQTRRLFKRYTSRCHVDDVCQVLVASMRNPNGGTIYNVVDDNPASRAEVEMFVLKLMGVPLGQASDLNLGSPSCEKRVRNCRIKEELGVKLIFPDYVSGMMDIMDKMT